MTTNPPTADTTSEIKEVFQYLRVKGAAKAIEFYKQVFGAIETFRLTEPSGRIGHAQFLLGNTTVMISDEHPEYGILGPQPGGAAGSLIHLHVVNADAMAARAVAAGATMIREPKDQFYGERSCTLRDPFGHEWMLGHQIEKVSPEEMQCRFNELCGGSGAK